MGRHPTNVNPLETGYRVGPKWRDAYRCEWAVVVGDRVRRRRRERGLTLHAMALELHKPDGGHYSGGYLSRLERGWASAPLYVYLAIAEVLDVLPGRLLGADEAQIEFSEGEAVLVRFLRQVGMAPHEALARLVPAAPPAPEPRQPGPGAEVTEAWEAAAFGTYAEPEAPREPPQSM